MIACTCLHCTELAAAPRGPLRDVTGRSAREVYPSARCALYWRHWPHGEHLWDNGGTDWRVYCCGRADRLLIYRTGSTWGLGYGRDQAHHRVYLLLWVVRWPRTAPVPA